MTKQKAPIETLLAEIMEKCEQYWNESGIGDPEIHAVLAFIHQRAKEVAAMLLVALVVSVSGCCALRGGALRRDAAEARELIACIEALPVPVLVPVPAMVPMPVPLRIHWWLR